MTRVCFFNLATTGFNDPDIIEIAAIFWDGSYFDKHIFPNKPMSATASEVTGYKIDTVNHILFWHMAEIDTEPRKNVLNQFLDFLEKHHSPVVLAAHNAHFHASLITRDMLKYGLIRDFSSVVDGFIDTLDIMKKRFPQRTRNFGLKALAQDLLPFDTNNFAKDALDNAMTLRDLIRSVNYRESIFSKMIYYSIDSIRTSIRVRENRNSLKFLKGYLAPYIINKLANSGIGWNVLKSIYFNEYEEGIEDLLTGEKRNFPEVILDDQAISIILKQLQSI